MAVGGLCDPQNMIVWMKNETQRKVLLSDSLKNSSTLSDWINHEKRVVEIVWTIRSMENDFQNLKSKTSVLWTDMVNFCLKYWASKEKLKKNSNSIFRC